MGRKGSCFCSVKKAPSPDPKEKADKKASKSKKKWFGKENHTLPEESTVVTATVSPPHPPAIPTVEEVTLEEVKEEQTKHAYSVAVATAAAAEAAVAAAHAAAEVVRLTTVNQFSGKSREEVAAIKVQTAFRGYLARRALRALRGLVRLKSLVDGPTAKRQTANALKCMQTLCQVQSQISCRRITMLEENQALQRQLMQKHAKELESLRRGEEWDDSLQSKERIEASLLGKYEAAIRRERALAYSYSHQQTWKKSSRSTNLLFMDPTNPQWGWSWLEQWTGAEKELKTDQMSARSVSIAGGEIAKSFARHQLNSELPLSPTTPSKPAATSVAARKLKPASPRVSTTNQDDDIRSMQSERNRRHSIAGSSIRDDESLASSPSVPSYMAFTQSAKAKTRLQTPLRMENGTPEKGSPGPVKKRLSYPPSPARPRRHSGPPKFDNTSLSTSINTSIAGDNVNGVVN
ncbi:putative mitochondrial import inner membrane translocase subunit TIM14-1-like [Capsicum annuum]|uniref:protein IQ-DOMAIN 3 n=1 Tax=Capsicum annuum TaxID=4072 RepID=UPI001FB13DC9|nr:protein IQ-DOMAIN 3 [Capsicum annuum]XP_016542674.2 protein IQ-DOMAIN 3 [Capsicum annuum]XP_016542675.2 protein IQ-DOMAIN 3 [Capsicum annuum]XP_047252041.1 protein IQ-DOMAIN 3 [Capsicum annuum]KAF3641128.1 putative mitochondrial import inner membrane translocase subunit TIM14-1-like [Capsicum annuum]